MYNLAYYKNIINFNLYNHTYIIYKFKKYMIKYLYNNISYNHDLFIINDKLLFDLLISFFSKKYFNLNYYFEFYIKNFIIIIISIYFSNYYNKTI